MLARVPRTLRYLTFSRFFIAISLLLSLKPLAGSAQQLVVHELSQGPTGTQEYVELLVVGNRTCQDSCMDIREWIIDDHNGWYGAMSGMGIATGFMRFKNDPNWSCVPYGSLILIYNDGDKNVNITLADDPTDANNDGVYVLPASSPLLEQNPAVPVSPSSTSFVYPTSGFSTGGTWSTVGLANNGDAFIVCDPATPNVAHFSLTYGVVGTGTVHFALNGGGVVYYVTGSVYNNISGWSSGSAGANETPGAPNSLTNAAWINQMKQPGGVPTQTNLNACATLGQVYNFNGQLLTTSGTYTSTFQAANGCDSIVSLALQVIPPTITPTVVSGCGQVVYNGVTYFSSAYFVDTVLSVGGCDSVYQITNIIVDNVVPAYQIDTLAGCGSVTVGTTVFTSSTVLDDTLYSVGGCDSVYRLLSITVLPLPQLTTPDTIAICSGQSATLTAATNDVVFWTTSGVAVLPQVQPTVTTTYTATTTNVYGCTATANLTVKVVKLKLSLIASDTAITQGMSVSLNTSANTNYTVNAWTPADLFPSQNNYAQVVSPMSRVRIDVYATTPEGCPDSASIAVSVYPSINNVVIPSAFTPNGDGINDMFGPTFSGTFKVIEFRIFNRWGQEIFNGNSQNVKWDGNQDGSPAAVGVYHYLIHLEGQDQSRVLRKGDVALIR